MRWIRFLLAALLIAGLEAAEPIAIRGYYFTFSRVPTLGLAEWKQAFDGIQADGGNLVLLWIGGGFRSRKFPITWQYNREHKNVEADFVRELIDYAHTKGIKVLLGFTPFSYDGVNQYTLEHPELKAVQKNGKLARLSGIHCWGYALNPSKPEAQRFMLEYARELFFDFYPNADGLMIESSDYAICSCSECEGRYYEKEFQFVKKISQEVWQAKPEAMILVYPHYFSGGAVPGFGVSGAKEKFDPRWAPFFTPHSAHIDPDLLRAAKTSIYWDESPARHTPHRIREGAQKARQAGTSGYVPSLEGFSFVAQQPEGGETELAGKRLKPFGFDWLPDGRNPYNELLIRVNRIAYREFTRDPALEFVEFKKRLGAEIFGATASPQLTEDLLELQESFFADRSWFSASPWVAPSVFKGRLERGGLSLAQVAAARERLRRIEQIARRSAGAAGGAAAELHRIAEWARKNWTEADRALISNHLR